MKYCFYLLLAVVPATTLAQHTGNWDDSLIGKRQWEVPPLPYDGKDIVYWEHVVPVARISKDALYENAKKWLRYNLKTDYAKITEDNMPEGILRGRGELYYNQAVLLNGAPQSIYFNYDIDIQDGAYTYKIYNLEAEIPNDKFEYTAMYREELQPAGTGRWTHQYRYEMLSDMDSFVKLFVAGLKKGMTGDD